MIVSCKKIAKNKYIVKLDLTEKITFVLQLDYLLGAVINIIKNRDFGTTAAFTLKNTLNIIFDNLNNIFIKKLFIKPSCELLIQDVIAGYKELERLIELQPLAKKRELSSVIRRIIAETDFKMLDGISISSYVFTTRFCAKNSFQFPETPSNTTKIYAIRINPRDSRNYYTTFDPDTLQGVLQPNGLLDKSLEKAQKDSLNTLVEGNLARSWFSSLQAIANDKDKEHTLHLFNSPPEIITSLDILRASFEIEEILHRSGLKSPAQNNSSLRRLLNLGGRTKSGLPFNSYILPSTFIGKSKSRPFKLLLNYDKYLAVKVLSDKGVRNHYINFGQLSDSSLLLKSLKKFSLSSESNPDKERYFYLIQSTLKVILASNDILSDDYFLTQNHNNVSIEQLFKCAEKITVILKGNKTKDALTITKNLFYFLGKYGDLTEVVDDYYGKIKASIKRESAVIVTPNCDSISKFLSPNGLLNTCFSNAKWDNYTTQSESLEGYSCRVSISSILYFLNTRQDIPHTQRLLNLKPSSITPNQVYTSYSEMLAVLSDRDESQAGVNAFMAFLSRYGGKIKNNLSIDCLILSGRASTINHLSYKRKRKFKLQLVHDDNKEKKFLPFDANFLHEVLLPESLLTVCLNNSEDISMHFSQAMEIRNEFSTITKNNHINLKKLFTGKIDNLTEDIVTNGYIEYESLLDNVHKGSNKTKMHKSNSLRSFINKWAGEVAGIKAIKESLFTTRFNENGEIKCVPPVIIKGVTIDKKSVNYSFNTYLQPNIYKFDGLLTNALMFMKANVSIFEAFKIKQWVVLIEHIMQQQSPLSEFQAVYNFLSVPLHTCSRAKVVSSLKGIEELIILRNSQDEESDFNTLIELFCLNNEKIKDGRTIPELNYQCRFSKKIKQENITFKVIHKKNGKVLFSEYKWDILPIKSLLFEEGLLNVAINTLAKTSINNPIFRSTLNNVFAVVKLINEKLNSSVISITDHNEYSTLRYLLTSPEIQITQRDVRISFQQLEKLIEKSHRNDNAKLSENFRRFLSKNSAPISSGLTISECNFKTRFSARKESKDIELIIPIDETTGEQLSPPAMEGFDSLSHLKDKINEYYELPIVAITKSAREEMKIFQKLRDELSPLVHTDIDGSFTFSIPKEVQRWVKKPSTLHKINTTRELTNLISTYGRKVVLGAFLQLRAKTPANIQLYCQGKHHLIHSDFQVWFKPNGPSMKPFFFSPYLLPKQILLVCFIRLIIHTTWNKDVIASLQGKDLPYPLPPTSFSIQGFKDKVKKETTPVEVALTDKEVREAIELISLHHMNMKELGFNPESIWETPESNRLTFLNASSIDDFINRYQLPKFRIEQLSKHQINVRKGVDGSIYQSQIERNHSHIKTTAGYIDHPLARIYYDANHADFQRRLEATVTFRSLGAEALKEYGISENHIDLKLLQPPGDIEDTPHWFLLPDGSTCLDIYSPIDIASKSQSWCGGRKCHSGDGCPHNKVSISAKDFVFTLRKQRWYIERYEQLLIKYTREYFDEYIAPAMRFTFGLTRFVQTANPTIYREAEILLTANMSGAQ